MPRSFRLSSRNNKKRVAIVTPMYRLPLTPDEQVSLRHLSYYLGQHQRYWLAPKSLRIPRELLPQTKVIRFSDSYFTGLESYNRLMLSPSFYARFRDYEFILIYQLDSLVFSRDLESWCDKKWDYVGAPWFKEFTEDTSDGFWAVGNGGLSLRRVAKFLEVLTSRKRLVVPPLEGTTRFFRDSPRLQRLFCRFRALAYAAGYNNNVRHFINKYSGHEDLFWAFFAREFVASFCIPSPHEALEFSFEMAPRYCFEANGRKLPFGCHGWYKIDPQFWRAFLLKSKLTSPSESNYS